MSSEKIKAYLWLKSKIHFLLLIFCLQFIGCGSSPKTDLRKFVPAETLVYLETNDIAETLQSIAQSNSFQQLAKSKPDFSALKNVQAAIAVTGFETSEKQIADESAILNFKPRFVLIIDTHSWESTTLALVENQLGNFVKDNYGDDVKLDKGEKNGIKFLNWMGKSGQKIFANVTESLIYISNDDTIIDKCIAVKKGESANLLNNESLALVRKNADEKSLAIGYIAPDGVAQLANLAGVATAINVSEEDLVRSFIAKILPEILQKTVKEISWTARKTEQGIEDKVFVKTDVEAAKVWQETLQGEGQPKSELSAFIPGDFKSVTLYKLQNPNLAWKSILMIALNQVDTISGKILKEVSGGFFDLYGIENAEIFLSAVDGQIAIVRFDDEGEESVIISPIKDLEKLKNSITKEINFKNQPEKLNNIEFWQSADKNFIAAFAKNNLLLGETESVLKCLKSLENQQNHISLGVIEKLKNSNSAAVTIAKDSDSGRKIVEILNEPTGDENKYESLYTTETRFNGNGIEHKTVSDFGLIGLIIEQFKKEN